MAALPDWLKKNIPKATLGTAIGAAAFAPDVVGVATAEHKLTAITKALSSIYFWMGKIFSPLRQALVGGWMILGFNAIGKAINSLVKDTGSLEAALRRLQSIRGFERSFTTLTGGLSAAKQRVAELLALSQRGPFKFEDIAEASKNLEVLTRGAMSGATATKAIGNVAITTGNQIGDVATAVGQFYSTLRAGAPIEGAVEQLRQMGIVSNFTADQLRAMAENGAPATVIFSTLTESLDKTHSSLREAADDLTTVSAEHEKAVEEMKVRFGAPWTQAEVQSTKNMTAAFIAITPALEAVSKSFATVYTGFSTTSSWLAKLISQSPLVQAAIESVGKAFSYLAVAMAAAGAVLGVVAFPALIAQANALATSLTTFLGPTLVRLGLSFTTITQGGLILAGTLRVIAGLIAGGAFVGGVVALTGVIVNLGISIKRMVDAHQEMRRAFNQGNDAVTRQINGARTLAEAHEALAKALEQSATAEKNLRDLQNDPNAAKRLDYFFRLKEAQREVAKSKDAVQKALAIEGVTTPEAQELARTRAQAQRHQEEIDFQRQQSRGGPEARISGARERAAVLEERAKRGATGVEKRAELAEEEKQTTTDIITAEADKKKAQDTLEAFKKSAPSEQYRRAGEDKQAEKDIKDADERLKGLRKETARIREQGKYAETPEGKGAEIEKLQRQMQMNKGLTEDQRSGMRATIAKLQIEQETLLVERQSVEANKERSEELKTQAELDERNLRLEKIRAQAELETARATGSPGERARKEFDITQRRIKAEQEEVRRLPVSEQNQERLKQLQAELTQTRTAERERIRGQVVTRVQTGLETAGVQARLAGRGEEAKTAEHVGNFVSKFEQLRQQFGDQEAKRLALQQEQNEIAKEASGMAGAFKPIADSLTRIGGGGGVGGPTGDPQVIMQQRQVQLAAAANQYLASIEQELRNQGAPEEEQELPAQGGAEAGGAALPAGATFTPEGMQTAEGGVVPTYNLTPDQYQQWQQSQQGGQPAAALAATAPAQTPTPGVIQSGVQPGGGQLPGVIQPSAVQSGVQPGGKQVGVIQPGTGIQSGIQPGGKNYGVIQPSVASPAPPAAAVSGPAVAPPAAPAFTPAPPAVAPPAAPVAPATIAPAVAPPAETAYKGPTIAQPGYHLPPSYAKSIGKTIGTKEYPLPTTEHERARTENYERIASAYSGLRKQVGVTIGAMSSGADAKPIPSTVSPGQKASSSNREVIHVLKDINRTGKQSNEHLDSINSTSQNAHKTL